MVPSHYITLRHIMHLARSPEHYYVLCYASCLVNVLWQHSSRAVFSKQRLCLPCALRLPPSAAPRLAARYSPFTFERVSKPRDIAREKSDATKRAMERKPSCILRKEIIILGICVPLTTYLRRASWSPATNDPFLDLPTWLSTDVSFLASTVRDHLIHVPWV